MSDRIQIFNKEQSEGIIGMKTYIFPGKKTNLE